MKTMVLLAAMVISVPCLAQKSKALQASFDACEITLDQVLNDSIEIVNENETLKLKIIDLEKQLEQSQTMAKFWAEFAAQGLKTPAPAPMPMPYPVYIDPPNVTVQPKIVIDRDPVKPFPPAPVVQDKQIFCTTQTYGNTEYTSCN